MSKITEAKENEMKQPTYTVETHYTVFNNTTGDSIIIGADRDGLGLIEIRSVASTGEYGSALAFTHDEAEILVDLLQRLLRENEIAP